jgi:hypothetical protein
MKLADLRRLAIKKQVSVRFELPNGMEALVDVHGTAQVPGLKQVPAFNIEENLKFVQRFHIEKRSERGAAQSLSPADLEKLISSLNPGAAASSDHEE